MCVCSLTIIIHLGARQYLCTDIAWEFVNYVEQRYCEETPEFYPASFKAFADAYLQRQHGARSNIRKLFFSLSGNDQIYLLTVDR